MYVYTGSAKKNMAARISRHRRRDKPQKWHIDYLLTLPQAEVVSVARFSDGECVLNQAVGGTIPAKGFGASDCKAGCGSHFKYLGSEA
jgi:Uri superfamily endonuclease